VIDHLHFSYFYNY